MTIITRAQWGAKYGQGYVTDGAKTLMIAHHDGHTRSRPDMTFEEECELMRFYENFHVNGEPGVPGLTRANPRIAYSFAIMQSRRIFEGCGWGHVGAHTANMNSSAYAAFFPVNGAITVLTPGAIESWNWLRADGVKLGHLSPNHLRKGHQDYNKPACPGRLVYDAVVLGIQPVTGEGPTVRDVVKAHPTLREGKGGIYALASERESVRYLQRKLALPDEFRTGYFGKVTGAALEAFQIANKLEPDRICGPKCWAVFDRFADVFPGSSSRAVA